MEPLELGEAISFEKKDGTKVRYDVVGIVDDPDEGASYAVLRNEGETGEEEFVVTDREGTLLADESVAQIILDEFLRYAEDAE